MVLVAVVVARGFLAWWLVSAMELVMGMVEVVMVALGVMGMVVRRVRLVGSS